MGIGEQEPVSNKDTVRALRDTNTIAEYNQRQFEQLTVVYPYASATDLTPAEQMIFEQYRDSHLSKRVLDIGVGGGRTTGWLASAASSYIGIDYSLTMIELCRGRFPEYQFEPCDARDLSRFKAGSFEFVLFSFNGIDFMGHRDRMRIMKEVKRLLVPDGIFAFSSHNLDRASTHTLYHDMRWSKLFRRPLHTAKGLWRVGLRLLNYARHSRMQEWNDGYAILLDPGSEFTLPMYYVNVAEQRRQLQEAGFDANPRLFPELPPEGYKDQRPYSFYYVTSKP
jgi:SAM-dependent methyltransferase